jgi:hypothetical protein
MSLCAKTSVPLQGASCFVLRQYSLVLPSSQSLRCVGFLTMCAVMRWGVVGRQWRADYGHHNLVPNNSDSGLWELWWSVRRYGRRGSRTSSEDDGHLGAVAGRCYARVRWNSWQQRQWAAYYIRLGNYAVVIEEPISHDMTFDYIRSNCGRRENQHNLTQTLNAINRWRYMKPNQTLFMDDRSTNQKLNIYSYVSNKYMLCTGVIFTHFAIPHWPTGQNDFAVDTGWLLLGKVCLHHIACRVHHIPGSPTHLANLGPLADEDLHVAGIPSMHWTADRWRRHGLEARDNLLPLWSGTRDNRPYHCLLCFHQGTLAPHCPGVRKANSTATANHQALVATTTRPLDRPTAKKFRQLIYAAPAASGNHHPR